VALRHRYQDQPGAWQQSPAGTQQNSGSSGGSSSNVIVCLAGAVHRQLTRQDGSHIQ
jgi:hypothetical protein